MHLQVCVNPGSQVWLAPAGVRQICSMAGSMRKPCFPIEKHCSEHCARNCSEHCARNCSNSTLEKNLFSGTKKIYVKRSLVPPCGYLFLGVVMCLFVPPLKQTDFSGLWAGGCGWRVSHIQVVSCVWWPQKTARTQQVIAGDLPTGWGRKRKNVGHQGFSKIR